MKQSKVSLIRRALEHARHYWLHIFGIFILSFLSAPIALLGPYPIKILVDSAFGNHPLPIAITCFFPAGFQYSFPTLVIIAVILLIVIELFAQLHGLLNWMLVTYTGEKLVLSFRTQLFNHVQRLSLAYHDKVGISDSIYHIQYDANSIRSLVISGFSPMISAIFTIIGMLYIITLINWHFTLIALAIIFILMILTRMSTLKLNSQWSKLKKQESSAMAVLHETLSALRVVKAFVREDFEEERFINRSEKVIKGQMKVAYTSGLFDLLIGTILAIGTGLFVYIGSMYVQAGKITLGELILVMAYLAKVFGPLQTLNKNFNNLQSSIVGIERAYKLIDNAKDVKEHPNSIPLKRISGSIIFENVSFEYERGTKVLQDISFEIKQGQHVGIMGSTGSGKTTLLNLLTRFYEPTQGRIIVDNLGIDIYKLSDYRSQFSIVLQEPVLFSTSIEENIDYGKPESGKTEIYNAARDAYAHDVIIKLPKGYQEEAGERGFQLSGGERQRISIARAFLRNSPVLILDEPTSSVDIATEFLIMEATRKLMAGKTTFLITHRLDTLSQCDIIIHLEHGKIVDFIDNNHPDLLEKKIISFKQKII